MRLTTIFAFLTAVFITGCATVPPGSSNRPTPTLGAIRWDAWVGDASPVGLAVEKSLSPREWHNRLPFFAKEVGPGVVHVRGNTQEVMDEEIDYAASAGLDYWAFMIYGPNDAMTRGGIDLYLASAKRHRIGFCAIVSGGDLQADGGALQTRLIHYFGDRGYQKVDGGRPLLFIYLPGNLSSTKIDGLRNAAVAAGLQKPYIVGMFRQADAAARAVGLLHLDAASSYASNRGDLAGSYAGLANYTEASWSNFARRGTPVVPWATAGWDRRPRVKNPVPWERSFQGNPHQFYSQPHPQELRKHVQRALMWARQNPSSASANTVILYAWNEFDEGGWIAPTLSEGTARVQAVRAAKRGQ